MSTSASTGPWFDTMRSGNLDVVLEANEPRRSMQKYLPASVDSENYGHYEDQKEIDLYEAMLHAADLPTQHALMHDFEKSGLGGTLARPKACCAAPDRVIHGYSAHRDGEQRCGRGSTIGFIGGWATAIRVI
jgi:hypothetical protein